jgi:hypothetical protein
VVQRGAGLHDGIAQALLRQMISNRHNSTDGRETLLRAADI